MACVVTGAGGFIGSHLAKRLLSEGEVVHVIVRPESNLWRLKEVIDELTVSHINLLDKSSLASFFEKTKPEKVFHLAAYGVYPTQKDVTLLFQNNVTATVNLISALDKSKYSSLVFTGSGFEYGTRDDPLTETDDLKPEDLYSFSKASLSSTIQLFSRMGGLPINIARLFLVYGKHEASTRLIPTLIKAYRNNESPQLNNPENVRDFVYIDDVIDALIRISDSGHCGEVYNIGSGVEHSVKEVANIVKNIFNSKIDPTWGVAGQRSFEPRHWRADIRKAEKMLSWKPQTDLVSGLEKIINEETQSR